jgi:catechol 2,3-dioxygenase-like lactoylglutathione lyase family enzyme
MAATESTNTEFELRGFNHLALVCRDMAETVAWYEDILGMKLVKTLELPGGRGQHFFLDMGNGVDGIAFFWFPDAPEGVKGEALQGRGGMSAVGSMNHLAFDVPKEKFDEYRQRLLDKGVEVTPIINHCCTSAIPTARCSSSRAGRRRSTRATSATRRRRPAPPSTPDQTFVR